MDIKVSGQPACAILRPKIAPARDTTSPNGDTTYQSSPRARYYLGARYYVSEQPARAILFELPARILRDINTELFM